MMNGQHATTYTQQTREIHTREQRPNESQKAVVIDVMKSVGEIASKIWPFVKYFIPFSENLILTLTEGQGHRHLGH